jgi:3D (Asp-Asp-Asp) domain-containing protein
MINQESYTMKLIKTLPIFGITVLLVLIFGNMPKTQKIQNVPQQTTCSPTPTLISTSEPTQTPQPTSTPTEAPTPQPTEVPSTENADSNINLGNFRITAYCNCSYCCGKWSGGPTASGVMPQEGRTIAVDPTIIPLGSQVLIGGHVYTAEDTGKSIIGNRIDIFFNSHEDALNWGIQYKDVQLIS